MKQKRPASYRRKCFRAALFCLLWIAAFLLISGFRLTPGQALRDYERTLPLAAPAEVVLRGHAEDGSARLWQLRENDRCLLFTVCKFSPLAGGWRVDSCTVADTGGDAPAWGGTAVSGGQYLFGKICVPDALSAEISAELQSARSGAETRALTLHTRDMLYRDGAYYFVVCRDIDSPPALSSYRNGQLALHLRDGTSLTCPFPA